MNRTLLNLLIDIVAAALFVAMALTGYILRFPLPPGTNKAATLWTLTRHEWGNIHFWLALLLVCVILVHLVLHWQWIVVSVAKQLLRSAKARPRLLQTGLMTISVLVLALGLFAWAAQQSVTAINESVPGVCPPDDSVHAGAVDLIRRAEYDDSQATLWTQTQAILTKNCLSCHGPARQLANFRADRRAAFFDGHTPLVVPGSRAESPLIEIVAGARTNMKSLDRHKLPQQDVVRLKQWIDAGAFWPDDQATSSDQSDR